MDLADKNDKIKELISLNDIFCIGKISSKSTNTEYYEFNLCINKYNTRYPYLMLDSYTQLAVRYINIDKDNIKYEKLFAKDTKSEYEYKIVKSTNNNLLCCLAKLFNTSFEDQLILYSKFYKYSIKNQLFTEAQSAFLKSFADHNKFLDINLNLFEFYYIYSFCNASNKITLCKDNYSIFDFTKNHLKGKYLLLSFSDDNVINYTALVNGTLYITGFNDTDISKFLDQNMVASFCLYELK
jgi:hypothetical protein